MNLCWESVLIFSIAILNLGFAIGMLLGERLCGRPHVADEKEADA